MLVSQAAAVKAAERDCLRWLVETLDGSAVEV